MESKEALERMLAQVDRDKRVELTEKLKAAATTGERFAILQEYGVKQADDPAWLSDAYDLSDEDLDAVAGGAPWDNEIDTNCCS